MSRQTAVNPRYRIPATSSEIIDRSQVIHFSFAGKTYSAYPGDTIASALAGHGVKVISRSFKYHRPRGLFCCAGHCPNCLVQIGDEPNVRACRRPVEEGMEVEPQNARPSLEHDVMSLTKLGERFMPVGFYYKTFIHPRRLWPVYEKVLREAAGLGKVNIDSITPGGYFKQYLHVDIAVIGGGPSGISAARTAAESGARVTLFDENSRLGGHMRFTADAGSLAPSDLQTPIADFQIFSDSTVLGWWENKWLAVVQGRRLYKIRAGAVVVATGAIEQPLVFDNNDLPGVMLGSGAQRLVHLYGVKPGDTAIIITANDQGWQVAAELQAAGITVAAIVDEAPLGRRSTSAGSLVDSVRNESTEVYWEHTIAAAEGAGKVQQAIITPVGALEQASSGDKKSVSCDLIALSVGWTPANGLLYQAGATFTYEPDRAMFLPKQLPDGVFTAGRVNGSFAIEQNIREGELAGHRAVAYLGLGAKPEDITPVIDDRRQTSTLVKIPGKAKRFVCFCEDVTDKDVETAIAEGYDSIELLKRYSTISMGPCQGKMCSQNTIHLCAKANDWSIVETGTTTSRPPTVPVELGVLAGQIMEPVRVTPAHEWHVAQGATMMVAGLWLRPEHYGDPSAEVIAVRQRVGLIDVSTLGKIKLTGPGIPDLLSKIYVNKWSKLSVGRVRYGLMCNDEGVIIDDGVTARVAGQEWYMTTTSSGAGAIFEWIQWWIQSGWGGDLHVTNVSEKQAAFNLAGPQARAVLQELTDSDLSNEAFSYMQVRDLSLAGVPCRLLRIGFTGELSYEIHCPASYGRFIWETIMDAGNAFGIASFGVEAQRILRLEKAHIIVGQDTDALTDPFSAGEGWAVKLDKDDFLGQRALTRIASEGSKQQLVGFKMLDKTIIPEEGLQIVRPNPAAPLGLESIGWVTSCRFSPTLNEVIGMCWLPPDLANQPGQTVTIRKDGKLVEARVHRGAFYDPEGTRLRR